ncbi:MAG: hypothetical protein Q8R81_01095 [Novosphingobium sp.]|uniref:hypothetical protein n=1 Tax=Novosphingobium sp. TaxID=1874826 RepID=UPI0027347996|nr:hypothetical protein [Novosphingobium sp.]MDP3548971.1 hypothetical protein [Novosphingobium sp.]
MTGSIKRLTKVIILIFCIASIPALFTIVSSLWMFYFTAENSRKNVALKILAEDVFYESRRERYVYGLKDRPLKPQLVYSFGQHTSAVQPLILQWLPSCSEPEVISDPVKLHRFRSSGHPFSQRFQELSDARTEVFAKRLGVLNLALLRSCLSATPFAKLCGDFVDEHSVEDAALIPLLLKQQVIRKSDQTYCWAQGELAAPTNAK